MVAKGFPLLGFLLLLLASCTIFDAEDSQTEAIAEALKAELEEIVEIVELKDDEAEQVGELVLCVESEQPLDVEALAQRFAGTILRLVPVSKCTSRTVEGDFGMFHSMTIYSDEAGKEAGHLKIAAVKCHRTDYCVVDIDGGGRGMRYEVEKDGDNWMIVKREMLWVV